MKKVIISVIILIVVILVYFFREKPNQFPGYETVNAKIDGKTYKLYVADTQEKHIRGLSGSKTLANNEGMLFIFPVKDRYSFWMKDMNYAIDIVFIDDSKIIDVLENIDPSTYPKTFTAKASFNKVVEFKAGTINNQGVLNRRIEFM